MLKSNSISLNSLKISYYSMLVQFIVNQLLIFDFILQDLTRLHDIYLFSHESMPMSTLSI